MSEDMTKPASIAYLNQGLFTFGAKAGVLESSDGVLTFKNEMGEILLTVNVTDIESATNKSTGWLFIKCRDGKKHKIAFFDPRPFSMKQTKAGLQKYGPLSGSIGTDLAIITSAEEGNQVAQYWEAELSRRSVQN